MSNDQALRAELARTRSELLALLAISQTLRAARDLVTLYHAVVTQINSLIKPDSLYIALYDPTQEIIRFVYSLDEGVVDDIVNECSIDESPLTGRVIRERRTIRIDDLDQERARTKLIAFGNTQKRSRAWLGVPMISGDATLGMLSVQSYQPSAFSDADVDLLLLLAAQVCIAVENAGLFERLRRTIAELSTPLIPLAEGVLLLPLIGTVDAERAERLLAATLDALMTRQAATLLLDVSGLTSVDAFVVAQITKLVKACALLGAQCWLVGLSAALAHAAVALGLGLERTRVFRDVQSALAALAAEG